MKTRIIYISLSIVVVITIAILAALISEGIFKKKEYLNPWKKDYYKNYSDPRIQIISHGILAANGHNMQSWKFVLSKENNMSFDLYIDTERLAKEVDPYHTQAMISQGTMYEYMDVAARKLGYNLNLTLIPDSEIFKRAEIDELNTKRVATITLEKTQAEDSNLYEQIFKPDTNRLPYNKEPIGEYVIKDFVNKNTFDNLNITYVGPGSDRYEILNSYIKNAAEIESNIERIMTESSHLFRKNENEKNKYKYGFSFEGGSMSPFIKHTLQSLLTLFPSMNNLESSKKSFLDQTEVAINNNGGYIMIIADNDTRESEFSTGRLYSRLQLAAHTYGLAVQPLSQSTEEYPEMESIYNSIQKDFTEEDKKILMLFRIGEPKGKASYSMRKDVMDFIK